MEPGPRWKPLNLSGVETETFCLLHLDDSNLLPRINNSIISKVFFVRLVCFWSVLYFCHTTFYCHCLSVKIPTSTGILYQNKTAHQKHLFRDSISDLHDEVNPSATELRALGQMAVAWAWVEEFCTVNTFLFVFCACSSYTVVRMGREWERE